MFTRWELRPIYLNERYFGGARYKLTAPLNTLLAYSTGAVLVSVAVAVLLCQSYWLGATFKSNADVDGILVNKVYEYGPAHAANLNINDNIIAVESAEGIKYYFKPTDTIVDPGLLKTYKQYREFFRRQVSLEEIQKTGTVVFILASGERITVNLKPVRPLSSLPWTLWYQIICASIALLASAIVRAFQRNNIAAFYYGFTGIGIAVVIYTNACFSSRELSLPVDVFYCLSKINWLGVCILGWGLIGTLWYYPRRLNRFPITVPISVAFLAALFWDLFEIPESLESGQRIPLYLGFIVAGILAWMQWHRQSSGPVSRAAMRWLFLSWFSGTGAFIFLVLIPITFNTRWGVEYVTATGLLPLLQIGVGLGILRYRLFDLDRWAMRIWLWVLGGLLVVLMDAALVYWLNLTDAVSLSLSLLCIGWVYFPLRQFLWQRLGWNPIKADFQQLFPNLLNSVFAVNADADITRRWKSLLRELYKPLSITELTENPLHLRRTEHGLSLLIPAFPGAPALKLSGANRGGRLMGPEDERFVASLWHLHNGAQGFRLAFEKGVARERERVARDLHDDIASDLLGLIYSAPDAETRRRAQNAFQELRVIIQGMENTRMPLLSNIEQWHADTEDRCRVVNIQLDWQAFGDLGVHAPSRRVVNLRRAFREAVSNVIKHSGANWMRVSILRTNEQARDTLKVTIEDNGVGIDINTAGGRGINNISRRLEELDGSASWTNIDQSGSANPGTRLILAAPLEAESDARVSNLGAGSTLATEHDHE